MIKINNHNNDTNYSPEECYSKLKDFIGMINELFNKNVYYARSDYNNIINENKYLFDYYITLFNCDMINEYCLKNDISIYIIRKALFYYSFLQYLIDEHNNDFINNELVRDKEYFDNILNEIDPKIFLDEEQRRAVLTDEDYCLIIAGAGAGKTTTVAAKVKYLIDKKGINPNQILVISFTNKAVNELRERINNNLRIDCPIATFHSVGNTILREKSDEPLNIKENSFLYNTINDYLTKELLDPNMIESLMLFFGSYFESPYLGDDLKSFFNTILSTDTSTLKSDVQDFQKNIINIREKKKITINNEYVRSYQEVRIANFLYMNGIDYDYETIYPYNINLAKKPYTPDFCITQDDKLVYLEHFGLSEDGTHKFYSSEQITKYKKSINDKIAIHEKHGTKLIYTYSQYNDGVDMIDHLRELLIKEGIKLKPRSNEEIYAKLAISEENKYISKLVVLLCRFINNFKTNGLTEDDFLAFLRRNQNVRTKLFLEIARKCYLQYQKRLKEENAVDFQDMINVSARLLKDYNNLGGILDYKYIIVDEYQDISKQRFDLTESLSKVTNAKIIAVGDDWQSIYAFSGSNINLFTKFCEKMGYGKELKIVKTYRNSQEVIDIAGDFVQKNKSQIKKKLLSDKHITDPVIIFSYDDQPMKNRNELNHEKSGPLNMLAQAIQSALKHIIDNDGGNQDKKVLVIGRYGFEGERLESSDLFEYIKYGNKIVCKKYPKLKIQFMTAHGSKGLGYDDVIIINTANEKYGFPCKIDDDPVLKLVTYEDSTIPYAEERRLFYVAMTRTKNRVYMVTPQNKPSEFVLELIKNYKNVVLTGDLKQSKTQLKNYKTCPVCGYPLMYRMNSTYGLNLYICTNEPEICNYITNDLHGGVMSILKCDKCQDGYMIVKQTKDGGTILGCTNYRKDKTGCNNVIDFDAYKSLLPNDDLHQVIEIESENAEQDGIDTEKSDKIVNVINDKEKYPSIALFINDIEFSKRENLNAEKIFMIIKSIFNNIVWQDRGSIIGIGESGMHLMAYFFVRENKIYVKFKNGSIYELAEELSTFYHDIVETMSQFIEHYDSFKLS